eukprot:NODE_8342_length_388_cov_116.339339.p1 GENE.NODE_8342_length_388_cov_116.339339~~NODE_8342_length_388_cov_116.339339.p1  ORF type:complete len:91 (+),score=13.46 NODE_8342_length_388_cov_116.339339:41-274(+)
MSPTEQSREADRPAEHLEGEWDDCFPKLPEVALRTNRTAGRFAPKKDVRSAKEDAGSEARRAVEPWRENDNMWMAWI